MSVIIQPAVEEDIPVLDEVSAAILDVERYLREHGWCKRTFKDSREQVCLIGAITSSVQRPELQVRVIRRLFTKILTISVDEEYYEEYEYYEESLISWNDRRSHVDEIYDLLKEARNG